MSPTGRTVRTTLGLGALAITGLWLHDLYPGWQPAELRDAIQSTGVAGMAWFAGLYVLHGLFALPATPLSLAAGAVWGPFLGTALVIPSATAAACAGFALGRTLLHKRGRRLLSSRPGLRAIEAALARESFTVVLLLRLSPVVPFSLLNVALGASSARAAPYALATAVGISPAAFALTWLGSAGGLAMTGNTAGGDFVSRGMFWMGGFATLCAAFFLSRVAMRALPTDPANPDAISKA